MSVPAKDTSKPVSLQMRDTLFGDAPDWPPATASPQATVLEPWSSFIRSRNLLESNDKEAAIRTLRQIAELPGLESRQYLQAWHFLGALGVAPPPDKAKQVLGVVVEVGMPRGLDVLAGYADHHARYWNFSGAGVVWERPIDTLDSLIDDLLNKGSSVVRGIGPWDKPRPDEPPNGTVRLNFLTPSGLHFGQGPMNAISKDPMGGPVLSSAFQLMKAMMALGQQRSSTK
jgi:hypothetical protein